MAAAKPKELVAEFVGTFLLVFTIGCNILGKTPVWAGVSIASMLMVAIYAFGKVSGANFNPAVSVALAMTHGMKGPRSLSWPKCGMYVLMQILGGLTASICYSILFWNAFYLGPQKKFGAASAGCCEMLYTFMLCFVVLNVATERKRDLQTGDKSGNQFYGLAIGFVIVAGAYGAGAVSGGCFNPAVAIAIDAASAGFYIAWSLVYTCFELLGAVFAAIAFKIVRPEEFGLGEFEDVTQMGKTLAKLSSEFLGTYMLVLTVGLNVLGNSPAGAFSIAASLMCMIYALGDVSGAHFNPAVSLAIKLSGKCADFQKWGTVLQYMAVQVLGAIFAGFTYYMIYGTAFPLGPQPGYGWFAVGMAEVIFTFVLCYVVLCTAVIESDSKSKDMFGLAIGSCVTVGGLAIGAISGGSLNPAVSVGISAVGGKFHNAIAYSLFEFAGGATAAAIAVGITHKSKA
jgi:aquaporin Z